MKSIFRRWSVQEDATEVLKTLAKRQFWDELALIEAHHAKAANQEKANFILQFLADNPEPDK